MMLIVVHNYVISLAGNTYETTQETISDATWTVDNILNSGYRYRGANPDNYVLYNNELWRIVGVINVNNVKYLKIISYISPLGSVIT